MSKKVERKTLIIACLILFLAGFFAGQFIHIPAFNDYNLIDAMRRPGSNHYRR